jgi:hypothetical protein
MPSIADAQSGEGGKKTSKRHKTNGNGSQRSSISISARHFSLEPIFERTDEAVLAPYIFTLSCSGCFASSVWVQAGDLMRLQLCSVFLKTQRFVEP